MHECSLSREIQGFSGGGGVKLGNVCPCRGKQLAQILTGSEGVRRTNGISSGEFTTLARLLPGRRSNIEVGRFPDVCPVEDGPCTRDRRGHAMAENKKMVL